MIPIVATEKVSDLIVGERDCFDRINRIDRIKIVNACELSGIIVTLDRSLVFGGEYFGKISGGIVLVGGCLTMGRISFTSRLLRSYSNRVILPWASLSGQANVYMLRTSPTSPNFTLFALAMSILLFLPPKSSK